MRSLSIRLAALALLIVVIVSIPPLVKRAFPLSFSDFIASYSASVGLDPALVAAIIQVESGFRPKVLSKKGAVGLMQIMPETAAWLAERRGEALSGEDLFDPAINIGLGTYYFNYLLERFPTEYAALAAYNGGPTNVRRWLDEGLWDGSYGQASQIPFPETRYYVRRVGALRHLYRFFYQEELNDRKELNP